MTNVLKQAYFHDEAAAFAALEAILWPNGPTCPHCGAVDRINRLDGVKDKRGRERLGLWKCYHCRGQFTVRKGTVFEASHLKLYQWFQAAFLVCSCKKGVSSNQLHRTLGVTLKTAWFVSHRLREAMREGKLSVPFGGGGSAVEADETFIGRQKGKPERPAYHHKMKVLTLVDRATKQARSTVIDNLRPAVIAPILRDNISREARLITDGGASLHWDRSQRVQTRNEGRVQHCQEKHLHRHLAEFDLRYNHRVALGVNDSDRTTTALLGGVASG